MFAMLAQTDRGKLVRQYFIQVEKQYKKLRRQQPPIVFNSLWEQRAVPFLRNTKIPGGYWSIYSELFLVFKNLEDGGFPLPERAVLDISVGQHWNKYLKGKCGIDPTSFPNYPHHYPDSRGRQLIRIYPNRLLGLFRDWLANVYMRKPIKKYLKGLPARHPGNEDLKRVSVALSKLDEVTALIWGDDNYLAKPPEPLSSLPILTNLLIFLVYHLKPIHLFGSAFNSPLYTKRLS